MPGQKEVMEPAWLCPVLENIPEELRFHHQWILWKAKQQDKKWTEIPYSYLGRNVDALIPHPLGTFKQVCDVFIYCQKLAFTGLSFALALKDPFVVFDLNDCRDPQTGAIESWALEILNRLFSYSEISPSGTGLRTLIKGSLPPEGRSNGPVKIFEHGRYLAITGHRLPHYPTRIMERSSQAARLYDRLVDRSPKTNPMPQILSPNIGGAK